MMRNQISRYGRPAAQFFSGGIALASVTVVSVRFEAGLATTAFGYLLVIVLLSLVGSFFVSVMLSLVAVGVVGSCPSSAPFRIHIEAACRGALFANSVSVRGWDGEFGLL